jgi:uncharacterized protein (TIGR02145 family)
MFNRQKISLFAICFTLSYQCLFSQSILRGLVTDNGGEYLGNGAEAVADALVTLTDQSDTSRTFHAFTDSIGRWSIEITPTGVSDYISETAVDFQLMQNYPNPFNPSTVISFFLSRPSEVTLAIYNLMGQKIKTLIDGYKPAGSGQVIWDATNDSGHGVAAGVYIYSMQADGLRANKKMMLIDGHQGNAAIRQDIQIAAQRAGGTEINKKMSTEYMVQVTGDDITGIRYFIITVARTVTDIDGNVYQTVKIGDQWWMAENLKVTHYQNGDSIRNVTSDSEWSRLSTGAYCTYGNNTNNTVTYGRLYNWYAVNDNRNIAPAGWHIPTDEEWKQLKMDLGMSQTEADNWGWCGTNEGSKMAGNAALWRDGSLENNRAFGISGFIALPGGFRTSTSGYFGNWIVHAYFWSSSESSSNEASYNKLDHYETNVFRNHYNKGYGFSVRGVRN